MNTDKDDVANPAPGKAQLTSAQFQAFSIELWVEISSKYFRILRIMLTLIVSYILGSNIFRVFPSSNPFGVLLYLFFIRTCPLLIAYC